ncbi:hypothetical protein SSAG_01362 [Streptomyces sp. Mg1]|nr:hypothetical protein SSAG_01362 [Streptomyces sp. Mg1]
MRESVIPQAHLLYRQGVGIHRNGHAPLPSSDCPTGSNGTDTTTMKTATLQLGAQARAAGTILDEI